MNKNKKRKRSSKEKRTLIVSLAMAGTLIAGSTFAWFTSKDEVTNRLSASADYGVSIVESFAPPANWLPGQTVNKDVYDVNTGNIAAFVKNDVKGVLNYTYESKASTRTGDCIKLNASQVQAIDGVTNNEGGGFLAWAKADDNSAIDVGAVNSARTGDAVANTWHPTIAGVYIFRRSIGGTAAAPTFTYAGYYFDGVSDYYKIVIGGDKYRAESSTIGAPGTPNKVEFDLATPESAITGITIDRTNGTFTGNPKIWYVKDTKVTDAPVTFKLDDTNKRLIVEYATALSTTTDSDSNTYDAVAVAARAEVDYINKLGASNTALIALNQATADYNYRLALANASNTLYAAAKARNTASENYSTAKTGLTNAWNNLKTKVENTRADWVADVAEFNASLTVDHLIPTDVQNTISGDPALAQCKANLDEMNSLQTEISNLVTEINAKYDELRNVSTDAGKTAGEVENIQATCQIRLTTLANKLTAYKDAYAGLTNNADVASMLSSLGASNITAKKTALGGLVGKINYTYMDSLATEVADYRIDWNANETRKSNDTSEAAAWSAAIIAYNIAVTNAKNAYDTAIAQTVPSPQNPSFKVTAYTNRGSDIVPQFAAGSITSGDNPRIVLETAEADFATYAAYDARTVPNDSEKNEKEGLWDAANTETNTAKNAYDEAVLVLDSSTKITIYVNLDTNYATNWTMKKATDGTYTAEFYLNKILNAAQTSDKLIDSVTFADTVTARDYKDLTFDLNINLDSAQITYADDQTTISTDAVTSSTVFGLTPTLADPTSITTTITWD